MEWKDKQCPYFICFATILAFSAPQGAGPTTSATVHLLKLILLFRSVADRSKPERGVQTPERTPTLCRDWVLPTRDHEEVCEHRLSVQFVALFVTFGTELLAASRTVLLVLGAKKQLGGHEGRRQMMYKSLYFWKEVKREDFSAIASYILGLVVEGTAFYTAHAICKMHTSLLGLSP